ncbi:hypothetical protein F5Y17DRAFT_422386 [Xylariaceae sp. FL0594]|nr:hypothetical protein F5Y17DRAFT_422386 [Xylariaceae sp. FL0594]
MQPMLVLSSSDVPPGPPSAMNTSGEGQRNIQLPSNFEKGEQNQVSNPISAAEHRHSPSHSPSHLTFAALPLEIRELIWRFALPESRVFNVLVWVSAGLKMQLLNRSELRMPLAHACYESRRVVREAGYVLAFRDEDEPLDPGVWFHPRKDYIERSIWGPGDWNAITHSR